jgi:hypothetical protein
MFTSIFNVLIPSRNLTQEFDKETEASSYENDADRKSSFLSSIEADAMSFISTEALSNKVLLQNAIFTKMEKMINEGGFEDVTVVKISYFFDTLFTLSIQSVNSSFVDKSGKTSLSIKEKRNLKDRIRKSTNEAKYILLECLSLALKQTEGPVEDIREEKGVLLDRPECIEELLMRLKRKTLRKEDLIYLKMSNVCALCVKDMENYDEREYINKRLQKERENNLRLRTRKSLESPSRFDQKELTCEATIRLDPTVVIAAAPAAAAAADDDDNDDHDDDDDHSRANHSISVVGDNATSAFVDEDDNDEDNKDDDDKCKNMDDDTEEGDKNKNKENDEKKDDEDEEDETKYRQEVNSHRHKRLFEDVSDNDNTSSDSYYEAEPKAILRTSMTKTKASRRSYEAPPLRAVNNPLKAVNTPLKPMKTDIFLYNLKNTVDKIYDYKKYFIFEMNMIFNADEVKKYASSLRSLGRMQLTPAEKLINHKSKKCKGRTISTLELSRKGANLSKEFIDSVMKKLISKRIIRADSFPCGSTGKATTIDLITSLSGAKQQEFHSDYDPNDFDPAENRQYDKVRNASILFNHTTDTQYLACLERPFLLELPPLSFIVMRGDFQHAGSANKSKKVLTRYFLYLDPYEGYRENVANKVYLCNFKK